MTPLKVIFICLQLLIMSYTVQSFVLLTANIDDIRKLARKFVSESLADKITDFVVQATQQIVNNADKEEEYANISYENTEYKPRNIAAQRNKKQMIETNKQNREKKFYQRDKQETNKITAKYNDWQKNKMKGNLRGNSKLYQQNQPSHSLYRQKPWKYSSKSIEYQEKANKKNTDTYYTQTTMSTVTTKKPTYITYPITIELNSKVQKFDETQTPSSKYLNSMHSENKMNKTIVKFIDNNSPDKGNEEQESERGFETKYFSASTKKERVEFDQYDNSRYPRGEYIATSGPVALPKIQNAKSWWDKIEPRHESKTTWNED